MTIVKEGPPQPEQHSCTVPNARDHTPGTVWCCPGCHRISIVVEGENSRGPEWNVWRFETDKSRRKRWKRGYVYAAELR
jgi:hypothetical protein